MLVLLNDKYSLGYPGRTQLLALLSIPIGQLIHSTNLELFSPLRPWIRHMD